MFHLRASRRERRSGLARANYRRALDGERGCAGSQAEAVDSGSCAATAIRMNPCDESCSLRSGRLRSSSEATGRVASVLSFGCITSTRQDFAVSGHLCCRSYTNDPNARRFNCLATSICSNEPSQLSQIQAVIADTRKTDHVGWRLEESA